MAERTKDEQTLKNLRPLVSIEYVRVNKIDGEFDDEELEDELRREFDMIDYDEKTPVFYGTVIVTDCWDDDLLYHRYPGYSEAVDEYISLIGPSRPISGHDKFIITVNFWARVWVRVRRKGKDGESAINKMTVDDDLEVLIDKEIARGEIEWDPRTPDPFSYEQLVQEDVLGKRGSVTVGYSVIRQALSATVKVVMTESIPQFYGTIKADTLFQGSSTTTTRTLFKKSRDHWVRRLLPQRPIFALPLDSHITIAVELWKYKGELSPDYQIAMGSVQFTPQLGTQMLTITTKNDGQVQVYITCE